MTNLQNQNLDQPPTQNLDQTSIPMQDSVQDTFIQDTASGEAEPIATTKEMPKEDVRVEEFRISGNDLVARVRDLIHQGNIRRIILKTEEGNSLIEIPLTVGVVGGVVGTAMFPVIAALGAIGALVAHVTIVIEKKI